MSDSGSNEETIFIEALQLSAPEERAAYLDKTCGDDPALRERVERMLSAEQKADRFLASDPLQVDQTGRATSDGSEAVGSMIGRYKLLQQIGEGGCGVVYMAEQEQPIRRRVALKVIKPGMDTRQVIARFEAERQAVSMMDHPNIARVLDAGATEAGRPYFVMELVRGIRITEYCDQNNLDTRARLELFTKVVTAVQHAHQKGIIHRDLKPSNILVTLHDGVPVPKVIDFGIAKALEQKLTDKTLFTQFEQFIGTPAYTSPEQAEMSGLDIDTRSDIYSLGVLLYELLVGKTPFDAHDLVHSGLDAMRRMIREQEPARPSTRLNTMLQGDLTTTAHRRRVSGPQLVHLLTGDLDWIVMKCLEKDRTRRYDTANGLAGDIEHYLGNEPVTARPPSRFYRFGKLVRRNKLAFAASTAVIMALVAGIVVSTWQAARARQSERAAKEEKESAEAVVRFFQNTVMAAGRPEGHGAGLGTGVTLRQAIDAAESQITKAFQDRPLVEAAIRHSMGYTYLSLDEPVLATPQYERALTLRRHRLGLEHPDTLSIMIELGKSYAFDKKNEQAVSLLEETLKLCRATQGSEHSQTVYCMDRLASAYKDAGKLDQALSLAEEVFRLNKLNGAKPSPAYLCNLASVYWDAGKRGQALPLIEEAVKLDRENREDTDHFEKAVRMANLGGYYVQLGKLNQGLSLLEEALQLSKAKVGAEHPFTVGMMRTLGNVYMSNNKYNQALPLLKETFRIWKAKLGSEHSDTLFTMNSLAVATEWAGPGNLELALPLYEESFKLMKATDHGATVTAMISLGGAYMAAGKLAQSEALYRDWLGQKKDDLHATLSATLGLARVLMERTETDTTNPARSQAGSREAEQLMRDYLPKARLHYATSVGDLESILLEVAHLRYRQTHYAEAELLYREVVQSRRARLEADQITVVNATSSLGRLLADWAWAERDAKSEAQSPKSEIAKRAREAEHLLRECLAVRSRDTNSPFWHVDHGESRLGGALVSAAAADHELNATAREAKLAEAETLLVEGHQRSQGSKSTYKEFQRSTLERLVRLYEAWGKPDQRSDWQQKLKTFNQAMAQLAAPAEQRSQ